MVFPAVLRSIPDKLIGVIAMFASILILFVLPWLDRSPVRSGRFRSILFKVTFWLLLADCVVLGFVGANPPEGTWLIVGRLATAWYFIHFFVILPVLGAIERPKPLPSSISSPVLGGGAATSGAASTSKPMEKA